MRLTSVKMAAMKGRVSRLSSDDTDHGPVVSDFMNWCESSFLNINVARKHITVCILIGSS